MIEGGIVVFVFISFYWLTVELCACSIVYYDSRWNCGSVQYLIAIVGGSVCMLGRLYWLSVKLCECVY